MPISRFEKFAPVDFNLPIFTPDFQGLEANLVNLQTEYDSGLKSINEKTFKNLQGDAAKSQDLRLAQNKMIDDITSAYEQNVGSGRSALSSGIQDITRDYSPGGQRYSINKQVETFNAWDKEQNDLVAKNVITAEQHKLARQKVLDDFGKIGGTTMQGYGDYNNISTLDINKYTDTWKVLEEGAKDWKPKFRETGSAYYNPKTGFIHTKDEFTRKTVRDEMLKGVLDKAFGDDDLMNYLSQIDELRGDKIDYSELYVQGKDGKPVPNMMNPLMRMAQDVVNKHTIDDESVKRDQNRDSFWVQQQGWARADAKEEEAMAYNAAQHAGIGGKVDTHPITGDKNMTDRIKFSTDKIAEIQNALKNATTTGLTEYQIKQYKDQLDQHLTTKANYERMQEEVINQVSPQVPYLRTFENKYKNELKQLDPSITDEKLNNAMASVEAAYAKSGMFGGWTFDHNKALAEALGISKNPKANSIVSSLYGIQKNIQDEMDRTEKGRAALYAQKSAGNDRSEYYITTSGKETKGSQTEGTLSPTHLGSANQAISGLPANLMFTDPSLGGSVGVDGDKMKTAIEAQLKSTFGTASKIEFDKSKITDYSRTSYIGSDGQKVSKRTGIVSIPYTDPDGNKKEYFVNVDLANPSAGTVHALVEKDIQRSPEGRKYIEKAIAEESDPGATFNYMKDHNVNYGEVVVRSYDGKPLATAKINKIQSQGVSDNWKVELPGMGTQVYTSEGDAQIEVDAYYKMIHNLSADIDNNTDFESQRLRDAGADEATITNLYKIANKNNR